jgi:predicted MFS family arabinose efflux permease
VSRSSAPRAGSSTRHRRTVPILSLLAANAISMSGNVAALVAIPWFVLQSTHRASKTGVTAFAGLVPVVLSGLFGGALIDRVGYRRTSVIADLASTGAVAAIPLLDATVGLSFPALVALVFIGGLLDAPGATARGSLLPDVATRAEWSLERASGAAAVVERASRLAGAPAAGVLIAVVGATNVLWIDAGSFLVSALLVAGLVPRSTADRPRERERYVEELRAGFRFLRSDRTLVVLVAVVTLTNLFDSISVVALPVLANRVYGTATSLGLMMGAVGAGSVVGALAFASFGERFSRRRVFCWGFLGVTAWYPVAAAFPPLGFVVGAKAFSGLASGPLNPVIDTVFYERVPDGMRGRVLGVTQASAWMAMPLGVLLAGPLVDWVGLRATFLGTGAVYVAVVLGAMALPALRGMDADRDEIDQDATGSTRAPHIVRRPSS